MPKKRKPPPTPAVKKRKAASHPPPDKRIGTPIPTNGEIAPMVGSHKTNESVGTQRTNAVQAMVRYAEGNPGFTRPTGKNERVARARSIKKEARLMDKLPLLEAGQPFQQETDKPWLYFDGRPATQTTNIGWPEDSEIQKARDKLRIIDRRDGGIMKEVLTFVPSKEAQNMTTKDELYALEALQKSKLTVKRGLERDVFCETGGKYSCVGATAMRSGKVVDNTTKLSPEVRNNLGRLVRKMDNMAHKYLPYPLVEGLRKAQRELKWMGFPLNTPPRTHKAQVHATMQKKMAHNITGANKEMENAFNNNHEGEPNEAVFISGIACGDNSSLNMHCDEDTSTSITTVYHNIKRMEEGLGRKVKKSELKMDEVLAYFCFPQQGIAIALRHGDILMFNPHVPHCISSRTNTNNDLLCTSFFLKLAVVGGNDKKMKIDDTVTAWSDLNQKFKKGEEKPPAMPRNKQLPPTDYYGPKNDNT